MNTGNALVICVAYRMKLEIFHGEQNYPLVIQHSLRYFAFLHLCSDNAFFLKNVSFVFLCGLKFVISFRHRTVHSSSSFLLYESDLLSHSVALSVEVKKQSSCTVHLVNKSNEYVAFKVCQQF
jgi:hypothetical protein